MGDGLQQLGVLLEDLLPLQSGEPAKLHVQDRLRLDLGEAEADHEVRHGHVGRRGASDGLDHLIQVIEGDLETLQDVGPIAGPRQFEGGAPGQHRLPVLEEVGERPLQGEDARLAVHQRQHIDAKGRLHGGVLVQPVEDRLGLGVPLDLDHDAHPLPVGFVAQIGDPLDSLVLHQIRDLLDEVGLVDLEGQLRYHDVVAAASRLLDVSLGPHDDAAAPRGVGRLYPVHTIDDCARWEIRPLHEAAQLLDGRIGVVHQVDHGVGDLVKVVGRDVGGHAHGDSRRSVAEEVREPGGQDDGLLTGAVVVGDEVDRVLVDVGHHLHGHRRHPGLGVPHGRGGVAVDGAEVALAVHQRVAHVEVLGHAHQRRVDHRLAVGVVVPGGVAADLGALPVRPIGSEVEVVHRDEDAALRGLQPVPSIGKRPRHDHAHGVIEVGVLHLLLDLHRLHVSDFHKATSTTIALSPRPSGAKRASVSNTLHPDSERQHAEEPTENGGGEEAR